MLSWRDNTLYGDGLQMCEMQHDEYMELKRVLLDIKVDSLPDAVVEYDKGTEKDLQKFEKAWRLDKTLRPSNDLLERQGLLKIADNIAGYSWYVTKVFHEPCIVQVQMLGLRSMCTNLIVTPEAGVFGSFGVV